MKNYNLNAQDALTQLVKRKSINTWVALVNYVQQIPYGRTSSRHDLSLVVTENVGSCSSKHAILKSIADANKIPHVALVLGMYKMDANNTPKIGTTLQDSGLSYIPEAHCYLKVEGVPMDVTTISSNFKTIKDAILTEVEIQPEQVITFKIEFHKNYLKQWLKDEGVDMDFKTLWDIREACITKLSR